MSGDPPHRVVGGGDPGGVGPTMALPEVSANRPNRLRAGYTVMELSWRLHHQSDQRAFGPAAAEIDRRQPSWVPGDLGEPLGPPRQPPTTVGHHRRQQTHRIRALAVPARSDVGLGVGVDRT